MLFILALNGSPHKEGNTAVLLNNALAEIRADGVETCLLQIAEGVYDAKNPFCLYCSTPCDGRCYKNTKLEKILNLLGRADGVLLGSPVYFGTVSAQLKSFWDKTRMLRREKQLLNVLGGALAVGGSRFGGQKTTLRALQDMMLCQGMIAVSDAHQDDDAGHQGAPVPSSRPGMIRWGWPGLGFWPGMCYRWRGPRRVSDREKMSINKTPASFAAPGVSFL